MESMEMALIGIGAVVGGFLLANTIMKPKKETSTGSGGGGISIPYPVPMGLDLPIRTALETTNKALESQKEIVKQFNERFTILQEDMSKKIEDVKRQIPDVSKITKGITIPKISIPIKTGTPEQPKTTIEPRPETISESIGKGAEYLMNLPKLAHEKINGKSVWDVANPIEKLGLLVGLPSAQFFGTVAYGVSQAGQVIERVAVDLPKNINNALQNINIFGFKPFAR